MSGETWCPNCTDLWQGPWPNCKVRQLAVDGLLASMPVRDRCPQLVKLRAVLGPIMVVDETTSDAEYAHRCVQLVRELARGRYC